LYCLDYINIADIPDFHVALTEKLGDELADDIIDAVKKHLAKKKK